MIDTPGRRLDSGITLHNFTERAEVQGMLPRDALADYFVPFRLMVEKIRLAFACWNPLTG